MASITATRTSVAAAENEARKRDVVHLFTCFADARSYETGYFSQLAEARKLVLDSEVRYIKILKSECTGHLTYVQARQFENECVEQSRALKEHEKKMFSAYSKARASAECAAV